MSVLNIVSLLLVGTQLILGLINKNWGLGLFAFIFIVFSSSMPFLNFLGLNLLRSSLFICILTLIVKDNLIFNFSLILKNRPLLLKGLIFFSVLMLPSFTITQFSEGFIKGTYLFFSSFILNVFVPGSIIIISIRKWTDFDIVLKWIMFSIIIMSLYGVLEYITDENPFIESLKQYYLNSNRTIFESINLNRLGFSRLIQSFSWHSIAYGGILSLLLPVVLLPLLLKELQMSLKIPSLLLILLLIVLLINVFLTMSRSAWLSSFIVLLIVYIYYDFFVKKSLLSKFLKVVSIALILLTGYYLIGKISNLDFGGSSFGLRIEQFNSIKPLWVNSGVFGYGARAVDTFMYETTNPDTRL